jgi:hypothetical protein
MELLHRMFVWWMVASIIHLPFPVYDGDDLKSWEMPTCGEGSPWYLNIDIDFILLGCIPPNDVDDGPFDADPRKGVNAPWGPDGIRSIVPSLSDADLSTFFMLDHGLFAQPRLRTVYSRPDFIPPDAQFSSGKPSRAGVVVLRC